jgi:hypothetical protein
MSESGDQGSGQKPSGETSPSSGGGNPSGQSLFPRPTMETVTAGRKPASEKTPPSSGGKK